MSETKAERRKKTINRIHRIQGQLAALEQTIENDEMCEAIVVQAMAVEKGMRSLITHMVGGYLQHQFQEMMGDDPETAIEDLNRIFSLFNR